MGGGATRRPTQADVARLAGVSQAVVSQVLNNRTLSIPQSTRERVLEAIARTGYVPNWNARGLRERRRYTVAAVIPDIANPFYPGFVRGIEHVADARGYDLVTSNTDGSAEKELRAVRAAREGRYDGVVGVFFHVSAAALEPLVTHGLPVVRLEPGPKRATRLPIDSLYVDNTAAAGALVAYLVERGHRRIGMIAGRGGPRHARLVGYRGALAEHGIVPDDDLVQSGDFREQGGYHAMRRLLALRPRPSAVFAANDVMAMGALLAAREQGLAVPGDIAVAGFDDIPAARLVDPPLTTVSQREERIGRRAAELLFQRLDGIASPEGLCEESPFELVPRRSA